jgi:hypothetical protein
MPPDPIPGSLEAGSVVQVRASGELLFRKGDPGKTIYRSKAVGFA